MAKLTLTDLTGLLNEGSAVAAVNNNNAAIETAMENTLSRDGTIPNTMSADLDMNSNSLLNVAQGTTDSDVALLGDIGSRAVLYTEAQVLSNAEQTIARNNIGAGSAQTITGVTLFNNRNGIVVPASGDYTASQITNTPAGGIAAVTVQAALNEIDTEKDAAIALKANIASPTFTGTPVLPTGTTGITQTADDNSTKLATTAYADAIKALKANLASPTFTGDPKAPTATFGDNDTSISTTAFTQAAIVNTLGYQNGLLNGSLTISAGSSALTIALKTLAGADASATDPITVLFRNVTGTTGNYVNQQITAASSLVISSGSTMGVTSSTGFRIWIVGFNDGGTFRLGAINCCTATQVFPLIEGIASSTAEGGAGAADSAGVIYTGTAVTSKAMRILGYAEWNSSGLTAGTWTTSNLATVQLFGPGVNKPGNIIQTVLANVTANDNTSGTTYIASSTLVAITPNSAANIMVVKASGTGDTVAGNRVIRARLSRGTTANAGLFGSGAAGFNANRVLTAIAAMGYDKPNTTSSTTYVVQIQDDTGGGANWGNSNPTTIEVSEIQA